MKQNYDEIKISTEKAADIALSMFGLAGEITALPGEMDFNFRVKSDAESFILKISRPDEDIVFLEYQQALLKHLANKEELNSPRIIHDKAGNSISEIKDDHGNTRFVRLLTWTKGRLWSSVNPIRTGLLESLGEQSAVLVEALLSFDHPKAHDYLEWDVAQSLWTAEHSYLFEADRAEILDFFQQHFKEIQPSYSQLRKSVIHGDINDNNILVSADLITPSVCGIIDFGDAIHTQTINDLAIVLAYAMMHKPDPLRAAQDVIRTYHSRFPIHEQELEHLYTLIAMRLVITITKSAINKEKEPDNTYHQISEKPAWEVLEKLRSIHPNQAHYAFRFACGLSTHPKGNTLKNWFEQQTPSLNTLFPELSFTRVEPIDMSVSSTTLGHEFEYSDFELSSFKINRLQKEHPEALIAGGYNEARPFYTTKAYEQEGNEGPEYRSVHLGIDFWVPVNTPVHSLFDAHVFSVHNNDNDKDYGPTIILEHEIAPDIRFYTLHGHLARTSLSTVSVGQEIKRGQLIGFVGAPEENGHWVPHLHFQIIMDMLGNNVDFPGVSTPNQWELWSAICPDPNELFKAEGLQQRRDIDRNSTIAFRKEHLGKSLSLSYSEPLKMVRGSGAYLIDDTGRKYLDTVNNVAHVGHEHPAVVKAGREQMAVLNTNSRYLHENINAFAEELLSTFPDELSVVHFVNSGSEANELALRMAKAVTGEKDVIAVEVGYHGNANACIDISSYKFDGKGGSGAPEHTQIVPLPDVYRGIYQGDDTGTRYANHVGECVKNIQAKGRNVSAFICESIISCGGQIELPENYLKKAYEYVREAGGLCISDEVQVGCGRMGKTWWGFQLHDVIPDIVTIGKPLGNGHPVAAVVCTKEVAEAFANGMEYFNTFGGNPVSCAIGKAVLQVVRKEKLRENAETIGNYLKAELSALQHDFPIIGDVRGQGLFLGFELVDQNKQPLGKEASYLANRMKDLGILMSTDGKDNNVLKIKPPMVFSKENADELIFRLKVVLNEDYLRKS